MPELRVTIPEELRRRLGVLKEGLGCRTWREFLELAAEALEERARRGGGHEKGR